MKPGEKIDTIILETEEEILVARDAADARSDASTRLSSKLREAEAPIELAASESQFVLHSLRLVRDYPGFREIEAQATRMLNDYKRGYAEKTGEYPALPKIGDRVRAY
jgi:hypothetical protein